MLNGFTNVSITKDMTAEIKKSLEDLAKKTVCIGIPDSTEHPDSKITNAQLMYIHTNGVRNNDMIKEMQHDVNEKGYSAAYEMYVHEHGSPLFRVPPRPILEPAIEYKENQEQIVEIMKDTVNVALDGGNVQPELEKVGMQGQNIARDWFTNPANNWAPNAKSTIDGWMSPWGEFFKGKGSDQPLIDTGEFRKSITYVVKDGDI
ncbi:hypothetical protein [Clostridium saccharoperbutylacetonicum]|uniref:hypothetical protein n=1 Tax=Clostridium saccharoperbutylacetonicum TaxID=36745 RepID=UPI0039E8F34D